METTHVEVLVLYLCSYPCYTDGTIYWNYVQLCINLQSAKLRLNHNTTVISTRIVFGWWILLKSKCLLWFKTKNAFWSHLQIWFSTSNEKEVVIASTFCSIIDVISSFVTVFPTRVKFPYKDGDFDEELPSLNLTFIPMSLIVDALEKDNIAMVWWIQLYNYVYTSSGLLAAGVLVYVGVG